jgi:hypothetical protein
MSLARMVTWINYRQGWRTLFWAGILVGTAAVLDAIPLFDVLGYDSAFALGLVTALAGADLGHGVVSAARRNRREVSSLRLAGEACLTTLVLLIPPLVLSAGNAVRVRNCNLGAGLAFFALLPAATAIYAAASGASVALLLDRPRIGRVTALALPFVSIGWALVRLYRDPAVFAFDPFGGYFPGPIYDEALRPPLRLLWYRLANLTWAATWVAFAVWLRPRPTEAWRPAWRPWWRPAIPAVLLGASWIWLSCEGRLGVHVTHAVLAENLPRETRTEHFILRTDPAAESDEDVARAAEDLEFRYRQLHRILGVTPAGTVRVYRFPSAAAKKEIVGAGGTLYTKPWTGEIFLHADRFPAQRLRHELAHIFASAFGDRLFGISLAWRWWGPIPLPRLASGLVEGVAEAADFGNPSGRSTLHEEAAAMLALGQAPPLAQAVGVGFTALSGPRAYTIAGSFCSFLLERFGAAKLRALYRSAGDFAKIYGQPLDALEKEWRRFLSTLPVDERSRAEAQEDFRRPAIFHKVCARELAARVAEARTLLGTAPGEAARLLESTCADDPGEPTYRLDLAEAQIAVGQPERALATLRGLAAPGELTRPLRARAANLEAGLHFRAGRLAEAEEAVNRALAAATEDADQRFAVARLRALRAPKDAATLGRVFFGDERGRSLDPGLLVYLLAEFARQNPDEALGPYLLARQLASRDPKLAVPLLRAACPLDETVMAVPLDPTFLKECRRLLGETAYLAGELPGARAAFSWLAAQIDRAADRLRAQDWLERVAWRAASPMLQPPERTDGTTSPHDRTQVPPR